jgi:hypothetical protein
VQSRFSDTNCGHFHSRFLIIILIVSARVGIWGGANEATGAAKAEPGNFLIETTEL